jgi:3D (Asp-Asp-Asp) domain-containing protein
MQRKILKFSLLGCLLANFCVWGAQGGSQNLNGSYRATAYAQSGTTASGEPTHRHIVAADPDVLPIGSRIRIRRAGKYSGEYVVADTGGKIQGRRLDIYMPSERACREFGSRIVQVQVLERGTGTQASAKQADQVVKQEVKRELSKEAVGKAATDEDWTKEKTKEQPPESEPKPPSR